MPLPGMSEMEYHYGLESQLAWVHSMGYGMEDRFALGGRIVNK